jgi:hypothetical protein
VRAIPLRCLKKPRGHRQREGLAFMPGARFSPTAQQGLVIQVNGQTHQVQGPADTPLLYVLRDEMQLRGPRFGCGLAQCGACTVHIDGRAVRSCRFEVGAVGSGAVTTLEGPRLPRPRFEPGWPTTCAGVGHTWQ